MLVTATYTLAGSLTRSFLHFLLISHRRDLQCSLYQTATRESASGEGQAICRLYTAKCSQCLLQQPSIQKLVSSAASDAVPYLSEETTHTDAYVDDISGVEAATAALQDEFGPSCVDEHLLEEALAKMPKRFQQRQDGYNELASIPADLA